MKQLRTTAQYRSVIGPRGHQVAKIALAATTLLSLGTQAAAQSYHFTDLGWNSVPYGINNAGQVVGTTYSPDYLAGYVVEHASLWNGISVTDLGTLGGSRSDSTGINNAGQVVGGSTTTGDTEMHATL